jgi:DNA-binding transcriptional regulator GbsR (MarR family)
MTPAQERFVDSMGDALAAWRLPRATGRVYGYLLLLEGPSTSESIREGLHLSAGAVSTSVRELAAWGLVRTIPQSGSRRLLIEAAAGFHQLLSASHERSRRFVDMLDAAAGLTEGEGARQRLRDVTGLFTMYIDAGDRVLRASGPRRSG